MVDKQLGFAMLALGFLLLVLVHVYNKWQEIRQRRSARRTFHQERSDVLMGEEAMATPRLSPAAATEPSLEILPPDEGQMPVMIHPRLDAMAMMVTPRPVVASTLWQHQKRLLAGVARPVTWFGFDERENLWRQVEAHSALKSRQWRSGMQLVNRRGPVSETEVQLYHEGLDLLGQEMATTVRYHPLATVLAQAEELNRFCMAVDVQIGINLVRHAQETFAMSHIHQVATAHELHLVKGHYEDRDGDGKLLFTLVNAEAGKIESGQIARMHTRGVTFLLDVPLVHEPLLAFDQMSAIARSMAQELGGVLVDDNRAAVHEPQLAAIRATIGGIVTKLQEWQMEPASPQAQRLFA